MDIRQPIINTMRQTDTPLSLRFFSADNINRVQKVIHNTIKDETGISIDRQSDDDLAVIMRYIYITNSWNPGSQIQEQISLMNKRSADEALTQVRTGLAERIGYLRDIAEPIRPNPLPKSTTVYGNKMGYNTKIGL